MNTVPVAQDNPRVVTHEMRMLVLLNELQSRFPAFYRLDAEFDKSQFALIVHYKVTPSRLVIASCQGFDELSLRIRDEIVGEILFVLPGAERGGRVVGETVDGVGGGSERGVVVTVQFGLSCAA